jgi:hypothetical protein
VIRSSSDVRVLRAVGVESEMELPFAALHQLCGPMLDRVDRLPRKVFNKLGITSRSQLSGALPDAAAKGDGVTSAAES